MRFVCLGSGSRGNATLIEADGVRLLVDCGLAVKELARRLAAVGVVAVHTHIAPRVRLAQA